MLIAMVVGVGCLQVAQRNAILLKGYAVGARMGRLHAQETDLSWVNAHVVSLSSPAHLAREAQERRLKLVAWSRLVHDPSLAGAGALLASSGGSGLTRRTGREPLTRLAADTPRSAPSGHDTSD